jgi:hypothetical protein
VNIRPPLAIPIRYLKFVLNDLMFAVFTGERRK